jgi:hypothetical protein
MTHKLAEQTNIVDKYLTDDLSADERAEFEEHLFDCAACAAQVKQDAIVIENLKQVLLEERPLEAEKPAGWKGWFQPFTLVPTFAALGFAALVAYQNLVYIPGLLRPQVLETDVIASAERGNQQPTVTIPPGAPLFNVNFEVDSPQAYASYICELQADGKGAVLSMSSGTRQTASFTLSLLLPSNKFPAGGYTMILRPVSAPQTEIRRYSFVIRK